MIMRVRRPVRPEPLPLRERASPQGTEHACVVWLNVRCKRSRPRPVRRPNRRATSSVQK